LYNCAIMRSTLKLLPRLIWHPFLLTLFALLSLFVANYGRLPLVQILRPLLVFFILAGLLLLLVHWPVKDWSRAGLITSLILLLFFSYGHVYGLLEGTTLLGVDIGRHRVLLPVFAALGIGISIPVVRSRGSFTRLTAGLNLITLLLVILQVYQLGSSTWQAGRLNAQVRSQAVVVQSAPVILGEPVAGDAPDIYFIILDTYTRQDAYQAALGFDNSEFLDALRERGFNIADCSLSNYNATSASLITSLDMLYLDELNPPLGTGYKNLSFLDPFLQNNRVTAALKTAGYTIVTFESGYMPTEILNTDVYLSTAGDHLFTGGLSRYESLLLQSSAGILVYDFSDRLPVSMRYFLDATYVAHRERILFELVQLGDLKDIQQPKFVFAHILAPHTPFVFTSDGQPVVRDTPFTLNDDPELYDRKLYEERFVEQTLFINNRVLALVDEILAQPGDPVIILQGDHGLPSSGVWVTTILNAIRLPGGEAALYSTRSPVNTFPLVFNHLFDAGLTLSMDRSCRFNRGDPASCEIIVDPADHCLQP
jgi:hypothetical protein